MLTAKAANQDHINIKFSFQYPIASISKRKDIKYQEPS